MNSYGLAIVGTILIVVACGCAVIGDHCDYETEDFSKFAFFIVGVLFGLLGFASLGRGMGVHTWF